MIVYKITNKLNGKVYVGLTRQTLAKRWYDHQRITSRVSALKAAISKYRPINFSVEVLGEYKNTQGLINAEKYYINYLNCMVPNGYNITCGGEAPEHSEASKIKMSLSHKGKKKPITYFARMSSAMKGRPKSSAHRKAMSEGQRKRRLKEKSQLAI